MMLLMEKPYPKIKADKIRYIDLATIWLMGELDEEETLAYKMFFKVKPEERYNYVDIPKEKFAPIGSCPE